MFRTNYVCEVNKTYETERRITWLVVLIAFVLSLFYGIPLAL
jgi:hypothetical protein